MRQNLIKIMMVDFELLHYKDQVLLTF